MPTPRAPRAITAQAHFDTPLGRVLLARTQEGLAGLWFEDQKWHPAPLSAPVRSDDTLLAQTSQQLADYFASRSFAFTVPLDLNGSTFQRSVWQALRDIPPGSTRSYGDIARQLGSPQSVRAVGAAVGRNPVSVIVPCHRVVGSNGSLTGYAGGLERKRALLELEGTI